MIVYLRETSGMGEGIFASEQRGKQDMIPLDMCIVHMCIRSILLTPN